MFPGYLTPTRLRSRDASFAALMELYENNYLRLRRLCPNLHALGDGEVSVVANASDLHLAILERTPYTTLLSLTYEFPSAGGVSRLPDLRIRMFHDAHQAEVVGRHCRRRGEIEFALDAVAGVPGLACRWRHNRFLFKWLGFCLAQGHRFAVPEPAEAGRALDSLI